MLGCGITEPTKKSCCDKKSSTEKCETKKQNETNIYNIRRSIISILFTKRKDLGGT